MNGVFKWAVILAFFVIVSCGRRGTPRITKKPQPSPHETHSPNDCKSTTISVKNMDCFFTLPSIKHGETFTGHYKDILNIYTKGVTVGKGKWRCENGTFYQFYSPVCLTCLPKHSLEQCQAELESLIRKI